MGRPTKLTEYAQAKITALLREGNHRVVAAEGAGISYECFRRWMNDERPAYLAFRAAVIKAENEFETEIVSSIKAIALTDAKVALELLARRYPERWAQQTRVEITQMLRREARLLADEYPGIDEEALIAEAEAILARGS